LGLKIHAHIDYQYRAQDAGSHPQSERSWLDFF
jgi:hypothetical protein